MFVNVRCPSASRHLARTVVEANIKIGYIFTILGLGAIGNGGRLGGEGEKGGPCTLGNILYLLSKRRCIKNPR